ncbi:hypothetical protein ABMA28_003768 [Loxostege sticticalis]|uniref:Gamma-tubulin complex component 6 n=1 Tax=Loxostege sticticalis TaxID=481309 RepID=A0ABD0SSZ9_LOXSC
MASSRDGLPQDGVFDLLTELCSKTAAKYCSQNRISQKRLTNKMRTHSYEIILKKTTKEIPTSDKDPVVDLLSYYLVSQQNAKNVAEFKRCVELKKAISTLRKSDFGENRDNIHNVLKFLVGMSNSVKEDLSPEMYRSPFSFGLFNEMLPKPPREVFGSPQPYPYFPSHVFELPYSLRRQGRILDGQKSQTYTEYTVESFDSHSLLGTASQMKSDIKTFLSPMSLASMTSTHLSPYSESVINYPRLTAPRDLQIPLSPYQREPNVKVSFMSTNEKSDMKEVFRANADDESVDIWELATQIDKDVPDDIWDIVSKLPPINERQLIASSPRELGLWKRIYADKMDTLNIISEKQFIRHIMYLIIGVETSSFPYIEEVGALCLAPGLVLEGVSPSRLRRYTDALVRAGTHYRRLYRLAFNHSLDDGLHSRGLVYEAAREVIRRYLLKYRLAATEIYEECCKNSASDINCMPTLLQIAYHMEPLVYEIETVASIYKVVDPDCKPSIPHGAELMSYLFNEISLVTHKKSALTMYTALYSICKVYFKFIERFIFEGELDDRFNEFFIRKDSQYINCRSKRYWDKGFHITQSVAVPDFLRPLAKFILLCGKSLRLLKLCNPSDPLVLLVSSDHPRIECCRSFEELSRQQELLRVFRTRCLFVRSPASFRQLLLNREAERKAFAEVATLKQAETMEKIVAERKRLAQLIIAEKQHSLRVLEAAMAEAKAAKLKAKQRERRRYQLEQEAEKASEEVDSRLREDERNKIMEYYSKLNMEVEKSKIHTEWKMKRLQLDQSRMQLLSTEERNLKREKLELEHQRNEEMAMSIQSDCLNDESESKDDETVTVIDPKVTESATSVPGDSSRPDDNAKSSDMFSVICNAAKSIFGVSKTDDNKNCDNIKKLDAQGNILSGDTEKETATSSKVIGNDLDWAYDNEQFLRIKQDAYMNKQKVMAHEFGQLDKENNQMKDTSNILSLDEENNIQDDWSPFAEAKRNKLKVLGAEFGLTKPDEKPIVSEPRTDAQKEALVNKLKVLGVEYNIPKDIAKREPATEAQEEALVNKHKIMGVEYNLPMEFAKKDDPVTEAQEEALVNKNKVMGVEYNLPIEYAKKDDPVTEAQEEALANKNKVMGVEYNLPTDFPKKDDPVTEAQEEALLNRNKVMGVEYNLPKDFAKKDDPVTEAQEEALVNRNKVMGVEYNLPTEYAKKEPATLAQEEALVNRHKIMGVEYNLPLEGSKREPATKEQEQALKNKKKMLGSDIDSVEPSQRPQRSALTLNLKPFGETSTHSLGVTPHTGAVTPGEFYSTLDLETPTTADVPLEGAITSDIFTPRNEGSKDIDSAKKVDKDFITSEGFNFPVIDDDTIESEIISDVQTGDSPDVSPSKTTEVGSKNFKRNISFFNILDGSYNLDEFDPFGIRDLKTYSKDHFNSKMDLEMAGSCYTHPAIIMEEVKKRPYSNIFASHFEEEKDVKITNDNIATLTACLQRSVMLPLTYQLEVVNNSILTYFLVNLDMYEHLRSLKDYFFLMDGEFSRSICHNLFSKLTKTLNPQELLNFATLHNILDKALGSSISHVHKFSENLSFTITESPLSFQHSSPDVLQCLSLTYAVRWPLNIILSQEALLRYAKVFQFLVKMRRIFWVLGEDFESLKLSVKLSKQHSRKLLKSPHYISIQIYRHVMASMIRALDNYIVTTCILSSWTEFENDLTKARTLDDLYECHVVYIKKVLFRCLLNNRSTPVMKLLNDIFTVILKFSRVLKAGEWQQQDTGHFTHTSFTQLQELYHLFEKLAKYLHKVVTKLMECGYQRHLVELLTMVNLNGYYDPERSKDEHNVSAMSTGV